MFLIERMVSLAVYAIGVLFTCGLLSRTSKRFRKYILGGYVFFLCILAYFYKPYVTADLYRLRQYIEYWVHLSVEELLQYASRVSEPSWTIYSYIVYKLGDINLLQTVACLWCFYNITETIQRSAEKFHNTNRETAYVLFMIMSIGSLYLQAISGIRTMLGFSIVLRCMYLEFYENKKVHSNAWLYIVAALFHSAVLVLVLGRFAFWMVQKKGKQGVVFTIIISPIVIVAFVLYGGRYIVGGLNKASNYLSNDVYSYIWEYFIGALELIQIVVILKSANKINKKENSKELANALKFCWICATVSIISGLFSYSIFRRYTIFCSMITIPVVSWIFDCIKKDSKKGRKLRNVLLMQSCVIFVLSLLRGDICGYKFFVLKQ